MKYTAEIVNLEKVRHQVRNTYFLDVDIAFKNESGETVDRRRVGLPATLSPQEVRNEVNKLVQTYNRDAVAAIRQAEIDRMDENERAAKAELVGSTVSGDEVSGSSDTDAGDN